MGNPAAVVVDQRVRRRHALGLQCLRRDLAAFKVGVQAAACPAIAFHDMERPLQEGRLRAVLALDAVGLVELCPHPEPRSLDAQVLLGFPFLGFQLLDPTCADGWHLLVLRGPDGASRSLLPIPDRLPQADGPAHAVLDFFGVAPGMAL